VAPAKKQNEQELMVELAKSYGFDLDGLSTALKATVLPDVKDPKSGVKRPATLGEVYGFCVVAKEYALNPFTKEIYAFPAKGGGMVPVVGVDGWLKIANRHPQFDGMELTFEWSEDLSRGPNSCTITLHRKDRSHPTVITEYLHECYRNTDPWNNQPARMLRNRTIAQGVRVAFGVSGIMEEDEAEGIRDVEYEVKAQTETTAPTLGSIVSSFAGSAKDEAPEADDDPPGASAFAGLKDQA
jgi:phage recombination protein Bet